METLYLFISTIVLLLIKESHCSGHVGINLVQFSNIAGLDRDGECCDGISLTGCPVGACDYNFEICVSQFDGTEKECKIFVGPQDTNVVNFTTQGEFLYTFNKWKGGVSVTFNVTDVDTEGFNPVDYYSFNITGHQVAPSVENSTIIQLQQDGSRSHNATSVILQVTSYCDSYYYADCSVKCVANEGCDGHYTCGDQGQKHCNPGWTGSNCAQIIAGSENDCSVYDNTTFEISQWAGKLNCNSALKNIFLDITRVTLDDEISGEIEIDGITTHVDGNYNDIGIQFKSEVFHVGSTFNLSQFDLGGVKKNSTRLEGLIIFKDTKQRCDFTLNRADAEDAFDKCEGKGTCVRFGTTKMETYCCCFDGTQGTSCNSVSQKSTFLPSITSSAATKVTSASPALTTTPKARTSSGLPAISSTQAPTLSPSSKQTPPTSQEITSPVSTQQSSSQPTTQPPTTSRSAPSSTPIPASAPTSTQSPSTEQLTEAKPSTSQPITASPTTDESITATTSAAQPTTASPTTAQSTTATPSTAQPTTASPTTASPTTTRQTTATPSTAQPTTTSPSTTIPTTIASTLPTTTEKPKPFIPNKSYKLAVAAAPEELDDDDASLEDLISEAYYEANIGILEKTLIQSNVTQKLSAIGDDGVLVIEITYILTINSTDVNITTMKQPTTVQWTSILHREYQIAVYSGINIWYLEYTYSIYATGRPPVNLQYEDLAGEIRDVWERNSSLINGTFNVTVISTEEYVGENGEEIYRLYYIVRNNSDIYHPNTIIAPYDGEMNKIQIFTMYSGQSWRYRFSYGVIFYDAIERSELDEIATIIQKTWNGVAHLNVSVNIMRIERYMGKEGEYLVKLLYFVERHGKVISPVQWTGPLPKNFKSWLDIVDLNGRYLQVYTSDVNYRYAYHSGVYLKDRIDTRDWTNLTTQIEMTWSKVIAGWTEIGYSIKIVAAVDYTTNTSEIAQLLTYYVYKGEMIIDGAVLENYYGVTKQLKTNLKVRKTNGDMYEVVDGLVMVELRTQFSFLIKGLITRKDIDYFETSLISTWNQTQKYINKELFVKINYIEEHKNIKTGQLVSKVYYSLVVQTVWIDAYAVHVNKILNFTVYLERSLTVYRTYQSYQLYTSTTDLVPVRYSYSLYFNTKITELDFSTLQRRLVSVLKTYLGITFEFDVIIAGLEEYYTVFDKKSYEISTSRQKVWKVDYYIKTGSTWVYPRFVRRIITPEITSQLHFQLLNEKTTTLYLESTTSLIAYNYHFSLDFKEPVYVTDWILIKNELKKAWVQQVGFTVDVSIQDLEQLVDFEGNVYYSLVYFLKLDHSWIYSANWQTLDLTRLRLDFLNVHGYKYHFFQSSEYWKLSYAFHIGSDIRVYGRDIATVSSLLQQTWCYSLAMYVSNCSYIEIIPVNQHSQTSASGITGWDFKYFVRYHDMIIDTTTWPNLNIDKFITYYENHKLSVDYKFFLNLDYLYQYFQSHLYLNTKVETKDYNKIKEAILNSWKKENQEYNSTTNVTVVIEYQKEKIDKHGESTWEFGYHVEINGHKLRPEATQPVNHTYLQHEIDNRVSGGKYEISTSITSSSNSSTTLVSTDYFNGLVVNHNIHKEDKIKFKALLEMYYRNVTNTSSETGVDVIIGPIKQVITSEGHLAWELSYHVSVNGTAVSVDTLQHQIEHSRLQEYLKIKTKYGQQVKLVETKSTHKTSSLFSVSLSHKVYSADIHKVAMGLKMAFQTLNPEYKDCFCVDVKVWKQQEQISESGKSSWKLHYGVSVHGRPIDASLVTWPTWEELKNYLTVKAETGYTITAEDTRNVTHTLTSLLHSLYFNSYVAKSSFTQIQTELKSTWSSILTKLGITGDVDVRLRRNTELSLSTGHSAWKLDYQLFVNSTKLDTSVINIDRTNFLTLQKTISTVTAPSGSSYQLLESSTFMSREYAMHFPLYFTTPVAQTDMTYLEELLAVQWSRYLNETDRNETTVKISQQKVMIDMEGNSVYQLVYYVTHKGEVLDSRLIDYQNVTMKVANAFYEVNPRGQAYKIHLVSNSSTLVREDILFTTVLSRPLTSASQKEFLSFIKTVLEVNMTDVDITVDVLQQEELITETQTSVWKAKFYIKVNGEYMMPISVGGLTTNELYTTIQESNMTADFDIGEISVDKTYYSYHDRFVIFFKRNVTVFYWPVIQQELYNTWVNTTEYSMCGCLEAVVRGIEEVVDKFGITHFKLIYFLKRNETIVNSQTSVDVNHTLLSENLKEKVDLEQRSFELVTINETETTRVESMLTVYLDRAIRIDHTTNISHVILTNLNISNNGCCAHVEIFRQMEFITIHGKSVWRVDLKVWREVSGRMLDVRELESLNSSSLQEDLKTTSTESFYQLVTHSSSMILDYRQSYSLYLQTPVRKSDLVHFETAVYNYATSSVSSSINVTVNIPMVTGVVDMQGFTYQKLSVFMTFNGNPLYPGHGGVIDINQVQVEIDRLKFKGAKGEYKLIDRSSVIEEDRRNTYSIGHYLDQPIRHRHFDLFQAALNYVWSRLFTDLMNEIDIIVKIAKQVEYTDIYGASVYKFVYYVSNNNKIIPSNQLPQLAEADLDFILMFVNNNNMREQQVYKKVSAINVVEYSSLFTFYMKKPVLLPDIKTVQDNLAIQWNTNLQINTSYVVVTSQEEVVDISISSRTSIWQVTYILYSEDQKNQIDSNYQEELNSTEYHQAVTIAGEYYNNLYVNRPSVLTDIIRYKDIFSIHFTQRVLETQYTEFQETLESSWTMYRNESVNVTITGQQEVISQSGKSAWKIFYYVTRNGLRLTSLFFDNLSYKELSESVNVTTAIGKQYEVMEVVSSFKLEEAFQVYVSQAVYRVDRIRFKEAVKEELQVIMPGVDLNTTEVEWRSQTSFLDVKNATQKIWRQLFIVRRNGVIVSAEKQRKLANLAVNATSHDGQVYKVIGTELLPGFIKEENLFSLSVVGRIGVTLSTLTTIIQSSWTTFDSNWTISLRQPEEYIGSNGAVITKIPYFVTKNSTVAYPDATRAPESAVIAKSMSETLKTEYSVYSGDKLVKYESCFSLSVKKEASIKLNYSQIKSVIHEAWWYNTQEKPKVSIEKVENFVGDYGVEIDQYLYTVTLNNFLTEPTFDVKPGDKIINQFISNSSYRWSLYTGVNTYRLSVVYSINLAYSTNMEFTSETRTQVETTLQKVWSTRNEVKCEQCSVSIIDRQTMIAYFNSSETKVVQLHYAVKSSGKYLQSYMESAPTTTSIEMALNQTGLRIWNQESFVTRSLYFEGYSRTESRETLMQGLQAAWSQDNKTDIKVTVTDVQRFVDEQWNQISRVEYTVSVNGSDATGTEPDSTEINQAFKKTSGKERKVCTCKPLKHHKVYVKGASTSVKFNQVQSSIKAAWMNKNNNSATLDKLLNVNVKQTLSRRRRAADNTTTPTKYIGKDGEEITPVDYTLSLDGQEPDPIFLASPSPADLDSSGLNGCNCVPRKAGSLKLAGNVEDSSKNDVQKAVYEAVVKANSDISPNDLSVEILSLQSGIKDANKNELSDVSYAITRKDDGDIEDVNYPTSAQLDEALKNNGLALYDKQKKLDEDNDDWKIYVAIAAGILAAIIIICIVVYVVVQKRKQKKMSLKKQEEDVANDIYDPENFSNAASFTNKAYETQEAKIDFAD
ncbi:hypothetical protein SNE40_001188 [Patella caerulea]|uniref:Delta-like protein n=1 Tax=Patella caerulea TaxID=87958 RepID=A0AAN8KE09_PATCE